MSRLFDDASSQYLEYSGAVVSAYPLTIGAWFNTNDATISQDLVTIVVSSGFANLDCIRLSLRGATAGDPVGAISNNNAGPAAVALTSTGFSVNTWHHACGVFTSNVSRNAFIDGGSKGSDTTDRTPGTLDRTTIGATRQASSNAFMSGLIADVAIWNVALSDTEVAALARGVSPLSIRPLSLVAYWPLWGVHSTEIDVHHRSVVATDYDLTVSGATQGSHNPPVAPFSKRFWLGSRPLEVVESGELSAAYTACQNRRLGNLLGISI